MAEEPTGPDVVALTRAFCRAGGRIEEEMSFYGPDPVYDVSPMGIGVFHGRAAIRSFLVDWMTSFERYEEEVQEILDLRPPDLALHPFEAAVVDVLEGKVQVRQNRRMR